MLDRDDEADRLELPALIILLAMFCIAILAAKCVDLKDQLNAAQHACESPR